MHSLKPRCKVLSLYLRTNLDSTCADVGDFGKYGLLRQLCRADNQDKALNIGVIWYLVDPFQLNESNNDDGKHTSYLDEENRDKFRKCDPGLWDKLQLIKNAKRNVQSIRESVFLSENTVFYEEHLKPSSDRSRWHEQGFNLTEECDIVFFDPDNGLQVPSVKKHTKRGPKYVFIDEIVPFFKRGQSLIIYQHANRNKKLVDQVQDRLDQLREHTGANHSFALHYCRGTARIFLIIPTAQHAKTLKCRAKKMCNGSWKKHFRLVDV